MNGQRHVGTPIRGVTVRAQPVAYRKETASSTTCGSSTSSQYHDEISRAGAFARAKSGSATVRIAGCILTAARASQIRAPVLL